MASKMFDKIDRYYKNGLWKINRVADMVTKKNADGSPVITEEEFEQITGRKYSEYEA